MQLHDLAKKGGFTFSATLHKNGDIIFGYYDIPLSIDSIEDKRHPVKVRELGLSRGLFRNRSRDEERGDFVVLSIWHRTK